MHAHTNAANTYFHISYPPSWSYLHSFHLNLSLPQCFSPLPFTHSSFLPFSFSLPALPHSHFFHFPFRLSFSLSVPLSLLPVSVCPPHLLFSPHLLPLSAQTGTRGKEMVTPCLRTHSIRLQKYLRKRLLFLCIQYMSILRQM